MESGQGAGAAPIFCGRSNVPEQDAERGSPTTSWKPSRSRWLPEVFHDSKPARFLWQKGTLTGVGATPVSTSSIPAPLGTWEIGLPSASSTPSCFHRCLLWGDFPFLDACCACWVASYHRAALRRAHVFTCRMRDLHFHTAGTSVQEGLSSLALSINDGMSGQKTFWVTFQL